MIRFPATALTSMAALLLLLAPPRSTPAAQRSPSSGPIFQGEVQVSWVLVPVVVHSRRGFVKELSKEDFRLWVDGRSVPIESFDSSLDAPLSLVWLQDLSGSMANSGKLEASRRAFSFFLQRALSSDSFALATFAGGRLEVEVPFTTNRRALEEAADQWQGWGTTTLHDAVAWVPEISAEGPHYRRAVVLVTDGIDNASVLDPAAARMLVRQARLPVYVIGLTAADPDHVGPRGEQAYLYAHLLELLAHSSGARFYPVVDPQQIDSAAAAIHDELRHQYVLGFAVSPSGSRRWRKLQVEVRGHRKRDLQVREGYVGGAPMGISAGR